MSFSGAGNCFYDDLYLYDLNAPDSAPLAYRCATGGTQPPALSLLLGLTPRAWQDLQERLYDQPTAICRGKCAVIMPICGRVGRFAAVVIPHLSHGAFVRMVNEGRLGVLESLEEDSKAHDDASAEDAFAATVQGVRLLISLCADAQNTGDVQACISLATELWGVALMPEESAEFPILQEQGILPDADFEPSALAVALMTVASMLRNAAHGRSGWLYAGQGTYGTVLHAAFRADEDACLDALEHLGASLEEGGVIVSRRDGAAPLKPPKQYAYMHKKIGDPTRPLCNLCGRFDAHCARCVAVRWAVLPYVTDQALLGIKNCLVFHE